MFWRANLSNSKLALKYVKRKSKNQVAALHAKSANLGKIESLSDNYQIYANVGRTNTDIITFELKNDQRIEFGAEHDFSLTITGMRRKRNFNTYTDSDIDKFVLYDGKVVKYSSLDVNDYFSPLSVKFSHLARIKPLNLSVASFVNFNSSSHDVIRAGYDKTKKPTKYEKIKLSSCTTWDLKIGYETKFARRSWIFTNIDANNILNKKCQISADKEDGQTYFEYAPGRNFWLQMGVKW